ncbi:MAG: hypothetical protein P4M09_21560 [Devosia sp.]|nr:hypothetical protein [Devosia sp.]
MARVNWHAFGIRLVASLASAASFACLGLPQPVAASEIITSIVSITQGSELTEAARNLEYGGYELAHGSWQSFYNWYHVDWVDVRMDMLTQYNPDFGVLWGVSTGEYGQKFEIEPSIKIGVIKQIHPTPDTTLSLTATTIFAGRLLERPCVADYGDIGGQQEVNCRLAAAPIPPQDTLSSLLNVNPETFRLVLSYQGNF